MCQKAVPVSFGLLIILWLLLPAPGLAQSSLTIPQVLREFPLQGQLRITSSFLLDPATLLVGMVDPKDFNQPSQIALVSTNGVIYRMTPVPGRIHQVSATSKGAALAACWSDGTIKVYQGGTAFVGALDAQLPVTAVTTDAAGRVWAAAPLPMDWVAGKPYRAGDRLYLGPTDGIMVARFDPSGNLEATFPVGSGALVPLALMGDSDGSIWMALGPSPWLDPALPAPTTTYAAPMPSCLQQILPDGSLGRQIVPRLSAPNDPAGFDHWSLRPALRAATLDSTGRFTLLVSPGYLIRYDTAGNPLDVGRFPPLAQDHTALERVVGPLVRKGTAVALSTGTDGTTYAALSPEDNGYNRVLVIQ